MSYTEEHLNKIDELLGRQKRNGNLPDFSGAQSDEHLNQAREDVEVLWQTTRLERMQEKLEMLKEEEANIEANVLSGVRNRRRLWVIGIVVGIVLLAVAGWLIFRPRGHVGIQNSYLAAHFEAEYILHSVQRNTGNQEFSARQLEAYNLYATQEFSLAIPGLRKLWEEERDTLALFYLGVSYVAKGDLIASKRSFERIGNVSKYEERITSLNK